MSEDADAIGEDPIGKRGRTMHLGMVGLGRMGANMSERLLRDGHELVVFDLDPEAVRLAEGRGARGASTLAEVVETLADPKMVWIMVPAGQAVDATIAGLRSGMKAGDVIIDGGNSNYKDTQRRAAELAEAGIHFVDVGTSGGVWGLKEGYSMMIGGEKEVVESLRPIFSTLAPEPGLGWGRVGKSGAGHFAKMIHNGIEYGMMQAYAEGFAILKKKEEFDFDLHHVAKIWQHGSVVRSWLLDLTAEFLEEDQDLEAVRAYVSDSGEGRWTVFEAIDLDVSAPVITHSLMRRFRSREEGCYADKILAMMRNQFGGHTVKTGKE